ncbi:hypothetical protein HG15A2_29130 [Adhaeretor mobilis]|uniref:Uncharacterized protein n=2 Tax=Adhaeretor mobilis TaxID=1930276 RepID=A0A517MXP3_9BACT|nr:hypothetical protein HG15A2_29130 [Adhaeretor mobilis]
MTEAKLLILDFFQITTLATWLDAEANSWNRRQQASQLSKRELRAVRHSKYAPRRMPTFLHQLACLENKRVAEDSKNVPSDFNDFDTNAARETFVSDEYSGLG